MATAHSRSAQRAPRCTAGADENLIPIAYGINTVGYRVVGMHSIGPSAMLLEPASSVHSTQQLTPPLPSRRAGARIPPDPLRAQPRAHRLARCERVHTRRRRWNEAPAGVSLSSLSLPPQPFFPQHTTAGPPSCARCERVHARRRGRDETPLGVSSSLLSQPPPPPSTILSTQPQAGRLARAASLCTRDGDDETRRQEASRRRYFPSCPRPSPPSAPTTSPPSRALQARAHRCLPPPQQTTTGPPSRALRARAHETTTTRRDASRRLVVISPPTATTLLLSTPSCARCLACSEPVHARRRRQNETPQAGVSESSLSPPPPPPPFTPPPACHLARAASPCTRDGDDETRRLLASRRHRFPRRLPPPSAPTTGPPSRALQARAHRCLPPPQQTTTGPPSRALRARAHDTATTKRDARRRLVVVVIALPPLPPPPPPPSADHHGPSVSRAANRCTRDSDDDDETRRQTASRRRYFAAAASHPPPPSADHHGSSVLRAANRCTQDGDDDDDETPDGVSLSLSLSLLCRRRHRCLPPSSTLSGPPQALCLARCEPVHARRRHRRRDARRRLVVAVVALPPPPPLPLPPALLHPTATTKRDASWRLVVVALPATAAFLHPPHPPRAHRRACTVSPCTRDNADETRRLLASRRRCFPRRPRTPPPLLAYLNNSHTSGTLASTSRLDTKKNRERIGTPEGAKGSRMQLGRSGNKHESRPRIAPRRPHPPSPPSRAAVPALFFVPMPGPSPSQRQRSAVVNATAALPAAVVPVPEPSSPSWRHRPHAGAVPVQAPASSATPPPLCRPHLAPAPSRASALLASAPPPRTRPHSAPRRHPHSGPATTTTPTTPFYDSAVRAGIVHRDITYPPAAPAPRIPLPSAHHEGLAFSRAQ
ncbi:hypothetical protein PLICRDRAFT_180337 [Plicaturopsis crispa FD-325 SS-3]|uniref:Uncharacterized protein n=1 Tax=Plicaturopsis crispa FD-325 SS-3 TaxID=944288 RepID=A0A0C9T2S1_PLICR|nr:hypothetical protein PLICRDRAFT_180337 [Plicaturopsis crispa FD-325 SS-3]